MEFFCQHCSYKVENDLYCSQCGQLTRNLPNTFSSDEIIAGLVVKNLERGKNINSDDIEAFIHSKERTFRILAQLERTENYKLTTTGNKYSIIPKNNDGNISDDSRAEIKLNQLKEIISSILEILYYGPIMKIRLLDMLRISKKDIETVFNLLLETNSITYNDQTDLITIKFNV